MAKTLHTPLITWLYDMLGMMGSDVITVPMDYRSQVAEVRKILKSDTSGIVNTMLDFSIKAALVDYQVQTDNPNLTNVFNNWLDNVINYDLRGKIPVGLKPLAKQYFIERWKGSSMCLLRTYWENVDGWNLPTRMWFVQGEDVLVEQGKDIIIGNEKYYLIKGKDYNVSAKDRMLLPVDKKNEVIFIQKPFAKWTDAYPVPYVIHKGLYENLKFLELLSSKGQKIVSKAIEYLFLLKKGTEGLAKMGNPEFIYSEEDLKNIKQDLADKIKGELTSTGTPVYTTNFDTDISHIIPDYSKAISGELYLPIERRLLAGLGLIEVVEGLSSTRKESTLNPKPFVSEVLSGIDDFKQLMKDIMLEVIERNPHKKKSISRKIEVYNTQPKEFITDEMLKQLRVAFDRGSISHRTYIELVTNGNYFQEVERRKLEDKEGINDILYPHLATNNEKDEDDLKQTTKDKVDQDDLPVEKQGPEAKNFDNSSIEKALYDKNKDLPEEVKTLPARAQTIWRNSFNAISEETGDLELAEKTAWTNAKLKYKKSEEGKWIRKLDSEIQVTLSEMDTASLLEIKNLEVLGKKEKLLNKLLEGYEKKDGKNS